MYNIISLMRIYCILIILIYIKCIALHHIYSICVDACSICYVVNKAWSYLFIC